MISSEKKELIACEVIRTLKSRFESFPDDSKNNRNAPFHEAFLNAFSNKLKGNIKDAPYLISLSSWLHGLNTTLGQSFFESVAHILSGGDKKEFTKKKKSSLYISTSQQNEISKIITNLKSKSCAPNVNDENKIIFKIDKSKVTEAMDFTADNYFSPDEVLVGDELWDRLSGDKNTMQQILDIINKIATPHFINNYNFLKNSINRATYQQRYESLLKEWNLTNNSSI